MADGNERLAADVKPPASSVPAHGQVASVLKAKPDGQENNHGNDHGLTEELKRRLDETRLPASLKEQILAQLPSAQEQERLYRDLQEKGGLSFQEFLHSLGVEVERQS
ncbi:MAG TPA: hypothetical protein VGY66_03700 [Gemmataceae bacterium]|jgi:hypothetical protein|nr:hypothetical protein [Gemmataceae bacterium]